VGHLDKTGKMSVSSDGQRFKDCKTGKYYRMKRIDGAMVILELSDGEDERREINILSSLLSVLHYGETRRVTDEKDTIIGIGHCSLLDAALDALGGRSFGGF
jgi:hypothetical protein